MMASSRLAALAPLSLVLLLAACGDDASGGGSESTTDTTGDTSGDASGDATTGDASSGELPTTSESSSGGSTGDGPPSPWDGEPLPEGPLGEWEWIEFPDARCRDGSTTGIGLRRGQGAGLMIYFQGGGACFNDLTCGINPSSFDAGDFAGLASGGSAGIFDPDASKNPVGDWNVVFVPYCTGDVHSGDNTDVTVPGVGGTHQFVGYANVGAYLERLVPTFAGVSHVLVTGESAGGFGAAFNYDRIADAFRDAAAVTLLDDSGPPLADDVLKPCLQQIWRDLWGMNKNIPADCSACFQPDGGGIVEYARYLGEKHADQHLALISSTADNVIRLFFGFGANDCSPLFPDTPADVFEAGLIEARDQYFGEPAGVWGSYFIDGTDQHTWLSSSYYTAKVDGVVLVDWVRDLIDGKVAHVGP